MGNKKTNEYQLMSLVALAGTATVTSSIQDIENFDNIFMQVQFVGTMTGVLAVEASCDKINWDAFVFNPSIAQPAGGALDYAIAFAMIPSQFFRVTYTNISGAGTLSVCLFSKDIN